MFLTLYTVISLCHPFTEAQMSKSRIWSKDQQIFVDLYSDPRFYSFKEAVLEKEKDLDVKYISGEVIKVSYYEEKNLIMFYENDTKITGICGEIWNLLAEHLNFTLKPIKSKERNFGVPLENGSHTGLMGMLERNEIQVIMRTGYYSFRADLLDYTMPIWNTKFHLYIQPEFKYDNKWIITIFSGQSWFAFIVVFILLCLAGYVLQNGQKQQLKKYKKLKKIKKDVALRDHVFYTYSVMCGQGYLPDDFRNQNRILSISKSMFAWLILIAFSSNLIYRMANRTLTRPFTDVPSLVTQTNYDILAFKGSMIYESLQTRLHSKEAEWYAHRFHFIDNAYLMYKMICESKRKFAVLESHDKVFLRSQGFCPLIPVGDSYYQTWIGFGLQKGYQYKSAIDRSILKLREVGLIDVLEDRWLFLKRKYTEKSPFKKIDIQQVYLILIIPFIGIILSLIILFGEKLLYLREGKYR